MTRNRKGQYQKAMGGRNYQKAKAELRARGDIQPCWSCGKILYADAPPFHPNAITLGHYRALEDGGARYDPNNYGAQCQACNSGDGARRTNARLRNQPKLTQSRSNPDW